MVFRLEGNFTQIFLWILHKGGIKSDFVTLVGGSNGLHGTFVSGKWWKMLLIKGIMNIEIDWYNIKENLITNDFLKNNNLKKLNETWS